MYGKSPKPHLIARYIFSENRVICDCGGWEGPTQDFPAHRRTAIAATKRAKDSANAELVLSK